jgi:hypothetical protein
VSSTDALGWLQAYYLSLCDGQWEHFYGFKIETIDNPGWSFKFDLNETDLKWPGFELVRVERSEHDWVFYSATEDAFTASCGPLNLAEAILGFRRWVETGSPA